MLVCVRVAGFGTTQVELIYQQQEKATQRSSAFSLLFTSLMYVQLWFLGVAAFETAIRRSQEKILRCLEHRAKALSSNPGLTGCVPWNMHWLWRSGGLAESSTAGGFTAPSPLFGC